MSTFAKRSVGYLLLLTAVGIVFAFYVQRDLHLDHLVSLERLQDFEQREGLQVMSGTSRAAYEDAYGEPSIAWYGLATLVVGGAGLAILEPGVRRVLTPRRIISAPTS